MKKTPENSDSASEAKEIRPRVIFADFATVKYSHVSGQLAKLGVESDSVTDTHTLTQAISVQRYDICVINLLLGGIGPYELLDNVRKSSFNRDIKIIVVTRQVHKLNIQNSMRAGASDFIAEPFEPTNLYNRILYHLGPVRVIEMTGLGDTMPQESWAPMKLLLESVELLSRTERPHMHQSFLTILESIAKMLDSNRTSLIIVDEGATSGVVLATSDDPTFQNFPVNIDKYPEVAHVVNTGKLIFVEDVSQNALTERIRKTVKSIAIGSMMVFPVCHSGAVVGALIIRRPKAAELPSGHTMRILQCLANTLAAHANIAVLLRKIYKDYPKKSA